MIYAEDVQYIKKSILQAKWPECPASENIRVVKKDGRVINANLLFKYFEYSDANIYFYIVFNEAPCSSPMEFQQVKTIDELDNEFI